MMSIQLSFSSKLCSVFFAFVGRAAKLWDASIKVSGLNEFFIVKF